MNVLFYSPSCRFCSEAVRRASAVKQQQLRQRTHTQRPHAEELVLVSVDNAAHRQSLPPFVDRVPLLFTADRRILLEDRLLAFLDGLIASSSSLVSSAAALSTSIAASASASAQAQASPSASASAAPLGDPLAIEGGDTSSFSWLEQEEGGAASLRNPFESVADLGVDPASRPPPQQQQQGAQHTGSSMMVRQQGALRPPEMPHELPDHLKPMVVARGRSSDRQISMDAILAARDLELGGALGNLGGGGGGGASVPWS